jgi:hypothetical protein
VISSCCHLPTTKHFSFHLYLYCRFIDNLRSSICLPAVSRILFSPQNPSSYPYKLNSRIGIKTESKVNTELDSNSNLFLSVLPSNFRFSLEFGPLTVDRLYSTGIAQYNKTKELNNQTSRLVSVSLAVNPVY